MQVSSSVSNRYYTPYQTNKSVKYCAGFNKTEDGKMSPNETTENLGFAEFVDYQEFHKAWMSQGAETAFSYTSNNGFNAEANSISLVPDETEVYAAKQTGAVSIAETEDEGEFLGLTMILEEGQSVTYGMRAMLSDKSTPDNPIVQVVSNLVGKKVIYNVEVNKVNPNNATQLEMFALLSYTDKMGITDGGTFGSHQQLEVYGGNASSIGYCGSLSGADVFLNERFDWTSIMEKMVQVYKDAGIENQAEDCKALFEFFATYTEKNEVKENTAIEVPEEFAGMSFAELINSGKGNANSIPIVNKIVNAKNPEDGKIYLTYFTENKITCFEPGGEKVWELEISNEEQANKAGAFFENYMPDRAHVQEYYSDAALGIVSSKEFWLGFFESASIEDTSETTQEPAEGSLEKITDYYEFIRQKIEELFVKIQNGDSEPTYQIGSQSFTEKEWEEFLDKFDTVEEAIQELMKEEQARKEAEETKKEDVFTNDASTLLTTESTSCVYETADPDDDDIRYITWYTEEGIFCRKAGQTEGYEWSITFENKEQYDKVMEFIGQFPSDWNMRFAAHENFWNDFLNDEIDMEGFMEFINGTNKGVPDYSITVGDSMYIDTDKMQWAKYTNPLGTRFYTAEEMHQMQMEIIVANEAKLTKLTDWDAYEEMYKENHPEYNGEKICCEYPGGPLYTVKEMAELQYRKERRER